RWTCARIAPFPQQSAECTGRYAIGQAKSPPDRRDVARQRVLPGWHLDADRTQLLVGQRAVLRARSTQSGVGHAHRRDSWLDTEPPCQLLREFEPRAQ